MAINGRPKTDPPMLPEYIGNVNMWSHLKLPVGVLTPSTMRDLGPIALAIRQSIHRINAAHIRSATKLIGDTADVRTVTTSLTRPGEFLFISSWADWGVLQSENSWGALLGVPSRVRIPRHKFDKLCIQLPRLADGGLEVLVDAHRADMELLRKDEIFLRFCEERVHDCSDW